MPRLGVGMPITAGLSQEAVTTIDDFFFESQTSGEVTPFATADRTNRLAYSEDLSQTGVYGRTNVDVASNNTTAPDGTLTADTVTPTTTNGIHTLSMTGTNTVAMSVFAKANGYNMFRFNTGSSSNGRATFDLSDGTIHATSGTFFSKASIEDHGNGWYRCSCVIVGGSATNMTIAIENGSDAVSFAADGTSGIHFWGAQSEDNTETTAYIPTTSSTVTVTPALNDTSEVWDFDTRDLMLEADPEDEGFWEEGSNLVLNHDYEDLGDNLVVNGTFETSVDNNQWFNFGSPTTAERSTARAYEGTHSYHIVGDSTNDGTQAAATQFVGDYTVGDVVKITAYVYPITAFNNQIKTGVAGSSRSITSGYTVVLNQWNKIEYYATITDTTVNYITFLIMGDSKPGEFYLDNVSAEIVDPNNRWTLGTGWSIEDGKAVSAGHSTHSSCTQTLSLPIGQYEVSFALTVTSGSFSIQAQGSGSDTGTVITSSGVHTEIFTITKNRSTFSVRSNDGNGVGSVDNVTVREYAVQPKDI